MLRFIWAFGVLASVPAVAAPMPGSDRDAHGCIPSAGYQWCAREKQCVRAWELAARVKIANTPRAIRRYCGKAK